MTKEEFTTQYAKRSYISEETLLHFFDVEPCDCGDETCHGWQVISKVGKIVEALEQERIMRLGDPNG